MPSKTYTVKRGENLTIEINNNRETNKPVSNSVKKGGVFSSKKEDEYQARRLKKAGKVSLYDLGQIKDGENWLDWDWNRIPVFNSDAINFYIASESDNENLQAEILAITNFANHSRKIEQAHTNHLFKASFLFANADLTEINTIELGTSERFTTNEIAFTNDELNSAIIYLGIDSHVFNNVTLKGNDLVPANKITETPSFEAEQSTYHLKNGDKIYLVPKILEIRAFSVRHTNLDTIGHFRDSYLNYFIAIEPRQIFLDESSDYYDKVNFVRYSYDDKYASELNAEFYENWFNSVEIAKILNNSRAFLDERDGGSPDYDPISVNSFVPSDYPIPPSVPSIASDEQQTIYIEFKDYPIPSGFLIAIIVRGNKKFYVWQ